MRKPLMVLAIAGCMVMSVVGGVMPILQGWMFLVLGIYLLATEFEIGRLWVKKARKRWPAVDRWIIQARDHKWAPRGLKEFEDITDPTK